MKAVNLTISVPDKGCDKNCPYCISRITPRVISDIENMAKNINKVKKIAIEAGVTSVLFTSKGEPFQNTKDLLFLMSEFKEWPLELQTNGRWLLENIHFLRRLAGIKYGLNVLALSVDSPKTLDDTAIIIRRAKTLNLIVRITVNANKFLNLNAKTLIAFCKNMHVDQLTIRKLSYPSSSDENKDEVKWIKENTKNSYTDLIEDFRKLNLKPIRKLPNLPVVNDIFTKSDIFDCEGIALVTSDYCIQEESSVDEIRSLIFHQDGHLYTSWDSKASVLF